MLGGNQAVLLGAQRDVNPLVLELLFSGASANLPNPAPDTSANSNDCTLSGAGDYYTNDEAAAAFQAWRGNGTDSLGMVSSDASISNIFDGGGRVSVDFLANGIGESSNGYLLYKINPVGGAKGWNTFIFDLGIGTQFFFVQTFTTGVKQWKIDDLISFSTWYELEILYNADDVLNTPTIKLDGVTKAITLNSDTTGGLGTRLSDATAGLTVGNATAGTRTWDGAIDNVRLYNTLG